MELKTKTMLGGLLNKPIRAYQVYPFVCGGWIPLCPWISTPRGKENSRTIFFPWSGHDVLCTHRVKVGDKVYKGTPISQLKVMIGGRADKIKDHLITANRQGTIVKVHGQSGDIIDPRKPLVEYVDSWEYEKIVRPNFQAQQQGDEQRKENNRLNALALEKSVLQQKLDIEKAKVYRAELEKELSFRALPLNKQINAFILRLDELTRADIQGQIHSDIFNLHRALKESFIRNGLVSLDELDIIPEDVLRVNQIETVLKMFQCKIESVRRDTSLSEDSRNQFVAYYERILDREVNDIEQGEAEPFDVPVNPTEKS